MHSNIVSALTGVCFAAVALASPLAEPIAPTTQIDAGCDGPIINVFTFTNQDCNNTNSDSPFFYQHKFAAANRTPGQQYQGRCQNIRNPGNEALSFVYTGDGADLDSCYLNTYTSRGCRDANNNNYGLDDDFVSQ